jgi:hypothetical protein
MKVAINVCYGGFGLSDAGFEKLLERKGIEFDKKPQAGISQITHYYRKGQLDNDDAYLNSYDFMDVEHRADPDLIAVIEEMDGEAFGWCADLRIVEIPDDVEWQIEEYDGREWVAEKHRTWY